MHAEKLAAQNRSWRQRRRIFGAPCCTCILYRVQQRSSGVLHIMKKNEPKTRSYTCMCRPLRASYTAPVVCDMLAPSSWIRLLRDSTSTSTNSLPLMGCFMILLFSAAHFEVFSIIELSSPYIHACVNMLDLAPHTLKIPCHACRAC